MMYEHVNPGIVIGIISGYNSHNLLSTIKFGVISPTITIEGSIPKEPSIKVLYRENPTYFESLSQPNIKRPNRRLILRRHPKMKAQAKLMHLSPQLRPIIFEIQDKTIPN